MPRSNRRHLPSTRRSAVTDLITLGEFILAEQHKAPHATGDLSQIFGAIRLASKLVHREINKAGIADITGHAGQENIQGSAYRPQMATYYWRIFYNPVLNRSPPAMWFSALVPCLFTPLVMGWMASRLTRRLACSIYHTRTWKFRATEAYTPWTKATMCTSNIGSLVADFHRNLLKGGIYFYPAYAGNPNGKLRLLYECNPIAMICEQAGGKASDGIDRILELTPTELHQRVPFFVGSKEMVDEVEGFIEKHPT